jgi:hypothetical protein
LAVDWLALTAPFQNRFIVGWLRSVARRQPGKVSRYANRTAPPLAGLQEDCYNLGLRAFSGVRRHLAASQAGGISTLFRSSRKRRNVAANCSGRGESNGVTT